MDLEMKSFQIGVGPKSQEIVSIKEKTQTEEETQKGRPYVDTQGKRQCEDRGRD